MIVANGRRWYLFLYFFVLYCFNCAPPLAEPAMCKPGLRSERERITPPPPGGLVDSRKYTGGVGGESIPVQVQHTTEHEGRRQHFCPQQLMVLKNNNTVAAFLPVPMTTTAVSIEFM